METEKDETVQEYHIKTIADILRYPDLDPRELETKEIEIVLVKFLAKGHSLRRTKD